MKTSIPGTLQVRRYEDDEGLIGDMIFDETSGIDGRGMIVDAKDPTRRKKIARNARATDLLSPVFRDGAAVAEVEGLEAARARTKENLERLHPTIRRFMNPHEYPVGLEVGLHELRDKMILQARRI